MFIYVFGRDGNVNNIFRVLQTCISLFFISACAFHVFIVCVWKFKSYGRKVIIIKSS